MYEKSLQKSIRSKPYHDDEKIFMELHTLHFEHKNSNEF